MQAKSFPYIYILPEAEETLKKYRIKYFRTRRQNYLRQWIDVLKIPIYNDFEKFIRFIEKITRYRIPIYNADIKPEILYLYENNIALPNVPLTEINLAVIASKDIYINASAKIVCIKADSLFLEGDEISILERFVDYFKEKDPDIIRMDYAFSHLPFLCKRLKQHNIECNFHRFGNMPITYKGGKSYFSYGSVKYQDYSIRLHGRFLIDKSTAVGSSCTAESIIELCNLSGTLFQQLASRSFGAVFQNALVRNMFKSNFLIPYKEKPIDKPMSMFEMLKGDRAGHTFDPKIGFHKNVAEIDFTSMFPWILHNHNIGADTILSAKNPREKVNDLPIYVSMHYQGLIPMTIKPFIDKRMEYKKTDKHKADALKSVLVSSYGYLRFREFKLGIPSSHMAICSYAREIIVDVARAAEEHGFELVHGIVDSLYIQKEGITKDEVVEFCREVEVMTGIPISFEGIYKWIVFLPSVADVEKPVPSRYYGMFENGELKIRGLQLRQRNTPLIVKAIQENAIHCLKDCITKEEMIIQARLFLRKTRSIKLDGLGENLLTCKICVAKDEYANDIPQKKIITQLKKQGYRVVPGQIIKFIFAKKGIVLPNEYDGKPDEEQYKRLIARSLYTVFQPLGLTQEIINENLSQEIQAKLV
jgi:DNA polymerase elongation subunit (family B)